MIPLDRTAITPDDLLAYMQADYAMQDPSGGPEVICRIGEPRPEVAEVVRQLGAAELWLITGWNPRSESCPADVNQAANRRLQAELESMGLSFTPAEGRSPDGSRTSARMP